MRIAINTRFLLTSKMEGFGWYTYEIVRRMVLAHPEHQFIFFFDRPFDPSFVFAQNVEAVVLNPPARHPVLFRIWFNVSVRRALKKHKADVFFSPDGYLCLRTEIPQIGVIHDINFEHNPQDIPSGALRYLRKYFPLFARKAAHIVTVSAYSKKDIATSYGISEDKITAIWNGASEVFQPLDNETQGKVRAQYSAGKDYLLFVGALHPRKNVNRLLEAFAYYKNAHPTSDLKLLVVGEKMFSGNHSQLSIPASIEAEVLFTGHLSLDELARVMAAAMIFTFVPYFEGFGIPLVEAMRCGTPILAGNKTSIPEVAGDAALYCDPYSVEDIYRQLQQLIDDKELRTTLSEKGLERSQLFSWDKSSGEVWKVLARFLPDA